MRRLATFAGAVVLVAITVSPAAAHGLGGRLDLPVPLWLFVYGAAAAVVVSFVALGALWKEPRLEEGAPGRALPEPLQRVLTGPVPDAVVRALSLATFVLVLTAAIAGRDEPSRNLSPVFVYVWFWVGLAFVHALFGNWWATLSPWNTLARFLGIGDRPRRPYPKAWGVWPAAILLTAFLWMELVSPTGANPRSLAWAIGAYTVLTLAGMATFGREEWNRSGEAFAMYFGLLSRMAALTRRDDGKVVLRPPLAGLPGLDPRPGLVAFVMVVIGSTTFDGFSGTSTWLSWTDGLSTTGLAAAGTAGLLATILAVSIAYVLAMGAASTVARTPWHPLAVRFVHSLVPIAFAYVAAHYASYLVLEGQGGIALLSDPFGFGWDLFGTATWAINFTLLSAVAVWYVQVFAIVAGHVAGVILAHDRSVAAFRSSLAMRTQYALLAVMVMFTMTGLLILSGG
ncbi:MAG: fenitrothion hydrolase [Actinomycetota bacterium]